MSLYKSFARPALFALDAEHAHNLSISALKLGLHPHHKADAHPSLALSVAGLSFPNPLGMAAGYDKGAEAPDAILSLGFGHAEIGTVTPQPQPGNPRPRLFRLVSDRGVINRFGFNSEGHAVVAERLRRRRKRGIVGINLGANKTSTDFAADYVAGMAAFDGLGSYYTINISSPNTPGLRALQGADPLKDLLNRVGDAKAALNNPVPVFLKIAPDLTEDEMDAIARALDGSAIDALIVSNTTLSRFGLKEERTAQEAGGLSGAPLFERATIVLARMAGRVGPDLPLIGVGGVGDAGSAFAKIEAGASLVQLYSAMAYEGPALPGRIIDGMARILQQRGGTLADHIGMKRQEWAEQPLN